jgi:hypothetical protein
MASPYTQGRYAVLNADKYIGHSTPKYRSGWELTFMRFCDNHPGVINWASESLRIPYINPFTSKPTFYVPDFVIMYQDPKSGKKMTEVIEVKPRSQARLEEAKSQREKAAVVLNMAKWAACKAWCQKHGAHFRIVTEEDIYNRMGQKKK